MLYMVTTNWFDTDAPGIGVFDSYEGAISAIKDFINYVDLSDFEEDYSLGCCYAYDEVSGTYITFFIEQCYLNISLT